MQVVSRRKFMAGLAFLAAAGIGPVKAQETTVLRAVRRTLEVNGKAASVWGIEGPGGRPGLSFKLGERFNVRLLNDTGVDTLIHWHGLTPPSAQDGVPVLSQAVLAQGQAYDYDFANTKSGTHWMHSHVGDRKSVV